MIETHIRQIAPLINEYADTIFCVQGLFVGDYGEMHDSAFVNDADMSALLNLLAEQVDPRIFLAVRTPEQWRNLTGVSNPSRSRQTELSSRVGLFNDGIMAGDTDFGTYAESGRAKELSFQNVLCQIVPNGGEVVGGDKMVNDGRTETIVSLENSEQAPDISTVINTLRTMRITYLNPEYDSAVIDGWKQAEYEGQNAYDYIGAHLGYRYELAGCEGKVRHRFRDLFAPSMDFTIMVDNTGFAPAYRRFEAELVVTQGSMEMDNSVATDSNLSNENGNAPSDDTADATNLHKNTAFGETQEILSTPIHCDNREWLPNEPAALEARLTAKQIKELLAIIDEDNQTADITKNPSADNSVEHSANALSVWVRLRDMDNGEVIRIVSPKKNEPSGVFLGELFF